MLIKGPVSQLSDMTPPVAKGMFACLLRACRSYPCHVWTLCSVESFMLKLNLHFFTSFLFQFTVDVC